MNVLVVSFVTSFITSDFQRLTVILEGVKTGEIDRGDWNEVGVVGGCGYLRAVATFS